MVSSIDPSEPEPEVLLFQTSPLGNLDGIVQRDDETVYFYLHERQQEHASGAFGMRAVWVQNLVRGPLVLDRGRMESGKPPLLPRTQVEHPQGRNCPTPESLSLVWLEEGNGAALVETTPTGPRTLAVIPPWSGVDGFHGYAAECTAECEVAWPLPQNPALQQRLDRANEFWRSWSETPDPFARWQPQLLEAYQHWFDSAQDQYFSIDGGKFPPRGLIQKTCSPATTLLTVGMSLLPQPMVEIQAQDPQQERRIELGFHSAHPLAEEQLNRAARNLSGLAAYPWRYQTWFGQGHTCRFEGVVPGCNTALLVRADAHSPAGAAPLPTFRGDPVEVLWLLPLTAGQQQQLEQGAVSLESLVQENRSPWPTR